LFLPESLLHSLVTFPSTDFETSWAKFYVRSFFQLLPHFLKSWTTSNFINPWW
jgi:hypothetical protein